MSGDLDELAWLGDALQSGGVGKDCFNGRAVGNGLRAADSWASHLLSVSTIRFLFDLGRLLWALANCQRAGRASAEPVALSVWRLALSSMMVTEPECNSITLRRWSIAFVCMGSLVYLCLFHGCASLLASRPL